ncbi:MAG: MmcQ/YjbR family DNA-binding protein [Actinomycetota bacterium]
MGSDGSTGDDGADEREEALGRLRAVTAAFPEVSERLSHGAPTFFIRGKKVLVHLFDDHHGDGRLALWCAAPPGAQAELVEQEPDRFFVPPYVGHRGWIGVRLDVDPDWDEIAGILAEAYRLVAPKKLVAELDRDRDG